MASQGEISSSRQEDQYSEAITYDAIKTEELQIDSILSMEKDVCNTQLASPVVEHGSHSSGAAETPVLSHNEPSTSVHEPNYCENDKTHQDGTNEKSNKNKIPKALQSNDCGQKYAHSKSLYRHQREAHEQIKLQKTAAGKQDDYTSLEVNGLHNSESSRPKHILHCDECAHVFSDKPSLIKHRTNAHVFRTCDKCDVAFHHRALLRHKQKCKGNSRCTQCSECGKKFSTSVGLLEHKRNLHESKSYVEPTPTLSKNIQTETQVDVIKTEELHIESVLPAIEEDVSYLSATSAVSDTTPGSTSASRRHIQAIHEGSLMTCQHCGNEFTSYAMHKHRQSCKVQEDISVSCDKSGETFTTTAGSLIHRMVSHGITEAPLLRRLVPAASEFTSEPQVVEEQVDAIKTEQLQIESSYPVAEESFSDHNTPSTSTKTDLAATSSDIATVLLRDERTLFEVTKTEKHKAEQVDVIKTEELSASTETDQGTTSASPASKLFRDECALLDVIKTEELHIESILPAVEEHDSDLDATSPSIDADQETTRSGVAIELSKNNLTVIGGSTTVDEIDSNSTMKRSNSAASELCCSECGKRFTFEQSLVRHIKIVHEGLTQPCEQCGNEFTPGAILKHRLSCKGPTTSSVSCDECGKKFTTMQSLLAHQHLTHDAPRLRVPSIIPADPRKHCYDCGRSFSSMKFLRVHKKVAHEGSTQTCKQCGNEFTINTMPKHIQWCKGPTSFSLSCDECGKKFNRRVSLLLHRKISHGNKHSTQTEELSASTETDQGTTSSSLASKLLRDECALLDVIKTEELHIESILPAVEEHDSDLDATSPSIDADQETTRSGVAIELSQNNQTVIGGSISVDEIDSNSTMKLSNSAASELCCSECGKSFAFEQSLKRHIKIVHEGFTQTCEQCGNEFTPSYIVKHRLSCEGTTISSVSCDECGKKFTTIHSLLTHRQVTHGVTEAPRLRVPSVRPVDFRIHCNGCQRSFNSVKSLRAHEEEAHKGSTETCEQCGNEYALYAIRKHRRSCKGPTLFSVSCDECGKKFNRRIGLLIHRQVSHGNREITDSTQTQSPHGVGREELTSASQVVLQQADATSPSTDGDQGTTGVAIELSQSDREVLDGDNPMDEIDSNSTMKLSKSDTSDLCCSECGMSFTVELTLRRHILIYHKGFTQTCGQCGNEYSPYSINTHRFRCKGPTTSSVSCDECGKKFTTRQSLLAHQQIAHAVTKAPRVRVPSIGPADLRKH